MRTVPAACVLLSASLTFAQSDDLARKAVEKQKDRSNWLNADPDVWPFAYEKSVTTEKFDGKGKVESKQTAKYDIVPITIASLPFHYRHNTTIGVDGHPVAADKDEARKQSEEILERVRKKVADGAGRDAGKGNTKGDRMLDEARKKDVLFWEEYLKAVELSLVERRELNGRPTSFYATRPNPAYRPNKNFSGSAQFAKFTGELWIDDADVEIVHLKYQVNKDISGGPFGLLGKVYAGSWFQIDLTKQFKDKWLPSRTQAVMQYRILLNSTRQKSIREFSNYREFTTSATINLPDRK